MCAVCFAQASVYVGGALGGLQVMATRVKAKRLTAVGNDDEPESVSPDEGDASQPEALASAT